VALHEIVAVPEPITLLGVITPQLKPEGTVSVRVTVPANPFNELMVRVEAAAVLTLPAPGEVAAIAKSRNRKVTVTV
jgi:hypothetical protein